MGNALLPFSVLTNDTHINRETNAIDYCSANGVLECITTDDDEADLPFGGHNFRKLNLFEASEDESQDTMD